MMYGDIFSCIPFAPRIFNGFERWNYILVLPVQYTIFICGSSEISRYKS